MSHTLVSVLALTATFFSTTSAAEPITFKSGPSRVQLVELYTSEGCHSCPPAEKWLNKLRADKRLWSSVVPVAFHVDYWDYIGWKDPFAHPLSTNRQKYYRHVLDNRYIYTPQFVIGGDWSPENGDESLFSQDLVDSKSGKLMLATNDDGIQVPSYSDLSGPADVWLVHFDRWHSTSITAGENAGRELGYRHVVREIKHLGDWRGEERFLNWPKKTRYGAALIIQNRAEGSILATLVTME